METARFEETSKDLAVFRVVVGDEEPACFGCCDRGRRFRGIRGDFRICAGEKLEAAFEELDRIADAEPEGFGDAAKPDQLRQSEEVIEPVAAVVSVKAQRRPGILPVEAGYFFSEEDRLAREFLQIAREGR